MLKPMPMETAVMCSITDLESNVGLIAQFTPQNTIKNQVGGKVRRGCLFTTNRQCAVELCKGNRNLKETQIKYK